MSSCSAKERCFREAKADNASIVCWPILSRFSFGRPFLRLEQLLNRQIADWAAGTVEHDNTVFRQFPHGLEISEAKTMAAILVVAKQDRFTAQAILTGIERCQQRENQLADFVRMKLLHAIALPADGMFSREIAWKTIVLLKHRQTKAKQPPAKA